MLIPLFSGFDDILPWISDLRGIAGLRVAGSARYLGVEVGPEAHRHQWGTVLDKATARVGKIRAGGKSLQARMYMFNTYVASLFPYKAQFAPIPTFAHKAYRLLSQRITKAPWQSFPFALLANLQILGMPTGLRDLSALSNASRASCIQRSEVVHQIWQEFDAFQLRDEASLDPSRPWHVESLALSLRAFWHGSEAERIRSDITLLDGSYNNLYKVARGHIGVRRHAFTTILLRRAARWTEYGEHIVQGLYDFSELRPPRDLISSVLRALLFGWCTTTRFHHLPTACWFCGADGLDQQAHYVSCPEVRTWYEERLGRWTQPSDEAMHAWIFCKLSTGLESSFQAAVALDSTLAAFYAKRHGNRQSTHALLDARFKEMRRRHRQIRDFVPFSSHEVPCD